MISPNYPTLKGILPESLQYDSANALFTALQNDPQKLSLFVQKVLATNEEWRSFVLDPSHFSNLKMLEQFHRIADSSSLSEVANRIHAAIIPHLQREIHSTLQRGVNATAIQTLINEHPAAYKLLLERACNEKTLPY